MFISVVGGSECCSCYYSPFSFTTLLKKNVRKGERSGQPFAGQVGDRSTCARMVQQYLK